jgi:hypothetical protein
MFLHTFAKVSFVARASDLFVLHNVQTGLGAHPASYTMIPESLSLGIKRPEREGDHSPPSSAEVKNGGAKPPLLHMSSWHDA